jgi:hypothetical protein
MRRRGWSVSHPISRESIPYTPEEELRISRAIRSGDLSEEDRLLRMMVPLILRCVGAFYSKGDQTREFVSLALEAFHDACVTAQKTLYNDNLVGYIISKINSRIRDRIKSDKVLYKPNSTIRYHRSKGIESAEINLVDVDRETPAYVRDCEPLEQMIARETLWRGVKTRRDRIILEHLLSGYNTVQMAKWFCVSVPTASKWINEFHDKVRAANLQSIKRS